MNAREHAQPFQREMLFRQVGPLTGGVLLVLLSLAVPHATHHGTTLLVQAASLIGITIVATSLVPWHRLPSFLLSAPPMLFLVAAFLLKAGTGGEASSYAQAVFLPLLWLAVFGTIFELAAGLLLLGTGLFGPLMVSVSTSGEWIHALLMLALAAAVGFGLQQLFTAIRTHADRLQVLIRTDPLTGVANRRAWDEEIARALEKAATGTRLLCVALLDVDHFKAYNDDHGHQAGDRLLKEITARWRAELRDGDTIARLGGDEFAIILPGCSIAAASAIVHRLASKTPHLQTCSAGVASWDGNETSAEFVGRIDAGLYEAKNAGRNGVVVVGA